MKNTDSFNVIIEIVDGKLLWPDGSCRHRDISDKRKRLYRFEIIE